MDRAEELFVRRFDDLEIGLSGRDEYELLKLAAGLRALLLDESPLLHQVNQERRLKIRFRVNRVGSITDVPVKPDILFHAHGLDPSVFQIPTGTEDLKLDDFLTHPVVEASAGTVTIADAIRFGANKAGGIHFDIKRTPAEARIDATMARLAALGVDSLGIALQTIARIVLASLKPLRDALVQLPPTLPLFAHYRLDRGASIQFDGVSQFLEANLSREIRDGFSWNAVIRVMPQPMPGGRVFYELGNADGTAPRLTILLDESGAITATAGLGIGRPLSVRAEEFTRSHLFDSFAYVGVDLCLKDGRAELVLFANNVHVATDSADVVPPRRLVTRHTIGASLAGQDPTAFAIQEIVIVDRCPTREERDHLAAYFWLQWHN